MPMHAITTRILFGAAIAVAVTTAPAAAQANSYVGMRVGYNFRLEDPLISAHLQIPMTSRIYFYPSMDVFAPETGNRIGFNGDIKIGLPSLSAMGPRLYAGAGIGITNHNDAGISTSDVGANFLFGIESQVGWLHPFAEGRLMLYNRSQFQMVAGVNIALGR